MNRHAMAAMNICGQRTIDVHVAYRNQVVGNAAYARSAISPQLEAGPNSVLRSLVIVALRQCAQPGLAADLRNRFYRMIASTSLLGYSRQRNVLAWGGKMQLDRHVLSVT